ncbi:SET domain-containing protein-lysine N-methyltransferase [Rhizobium sp. BK376]|uniref:SET domain-containing protein n=1 Tax=Rhizobium sp. BK376 TaxID=2512149 RepID=UPI00104C9322|nr:SET domain-containing protein-lysine N-methyltransferase [Rhizobium sp. BK376]TCR92675.1 hypothetical protein EV561_101110 [Rhizobium sp. BK376]
MSFTWFSPKVEKRKSRIEGTGLVAIEAIAAGELIVVKGGHIFERAERDEIGKRLGPSEIQIDHHLFIGPSRAHERDAAMMYLNHSCDPNVGVRGQISFFAMRDIESGEELAFDYATGDNDDWVMNCQCGASDCRKRITGQDWRLPDLQRKYRGWFSDYLAREIGDD